MKIVKDSILDLNDSFIGVIKKFYTDANGNFFVGCNLALNVVYFEYEEDSHFQEEHMREVLEPDRDVGGVPEEISWETCLAELKDYLKHPSFKGEGVVHLQRIDEPDPKLGEKRSLVLINELSKYIFLPPEKTYRYVPNENAWFFKDIVPWYFCYVFLHSGKGMVINAYAQV